MLKVLRAYDSLHERPLPTINFRQPYLGDVVDESIINDVNMLAVRNIANIFACTRSRISNEMMMESDRILLSQAWSAQSYLTLRTRRCFGTGWPSSWSRFARVVRMTTSKYWERKLSRRELYLFLSPSYVLTQVLGKLWRRNPPSCHRQSPIHGSTKYLYRFFSPLNLSSLGILKSSITLLLHVLSLVVCS